MEIPAVILYAIAGERKNAADALALLFISSFILFFCLYWKTLVSRCYIIHLETFLSVILYETKKFALNHE